MRGLEKFIPAAGHEDDDICDKTYLEKIFCKYIQQDAKVSFCQKSTDLKVTAQHKNLQSYKKR